MRHELVQGRPGNSGGWRVATYLIRRLGTSVVILIGISIFIFALLHLVFPSPAVIVLGVKASPPAIAAWNRANGFDDPVLVQYWHYVDGVIHGNLGGSRSAGRRAGKE